MGRWALIGTCAVALTAIICSKQYYNSNSDPVITPKASAEVVEPIQKYSRSRMVDSRPSCRRSTDSRSGHVDFAQIYTTLTRLDNTMVDKIYDMNPGDCALATLGLVQKLEAELEHDTLGTYACELPLPGGGSMSIDTKGVEVLREYFPNGLEEEFGYRTLSLTLMDEESADTGRGRCLDVDIVRYYYEFNSPRTTIQIKTIDDNGFWTYNLDYTEGWGTASCSRSKFCVFPRMGPMYFLDFAVREVYFESYMKVDEAMDAIDEMYW